MMRAGLLDAALLARLRRHLAERLAGAPAGALLSLTLDLGAGEDDWLGAGLGETPFNYWAQPAAGEYRLGLGRAITFATAGRARFPALQAALAGLAPAWLHGGDAAGEMGGKAPGGVQPAAFLGFAFDAQQAGEAGEWPNAQLTVPAVLLVSRGGRRCAVFSCIARDAESAPQAWLAALQPGPRPPAAPGALLRVPSPVADRAWLARVGAALADIEAGRLDKVVLARSVRLRAGRPLAVAPLLRALNARQPHGTTYAVGEGGRAFLGATPELLVSLGGGIARADALAGTAWRCGEPRPASRDLSDEKNGREQRLVLDAVRAALAPLCERLQAPPVPEVLRLGALQHLRSRVEGPVRPGVGLFDLVARLHPTPAVGGAPGTAALDWLRRHGERRGGWYSGGIGWIGREGDGEVRVALRCALVGGREAELFAGAGIVAGSAPAEELAETEAKLDTMLDAIAHADAAAGAALARTGTQ